MLNIKAILSAGVSAVGGEETPCPRADLGIFGAMALLAAVQAGAEPGFRCLRAFTGYGSRLAPHRALRHRILAALMESGVLVPAASKRRLDDFVADGTWGEESLEDADWTIQWDDRSRSSLPEQLTEMLDSFESTARTREVLLETWQALGTAECLAFAEYALATHNLNPAVARSAAPSLQPLLAQLSIGHGCAIMWYATKHLASWFLRQGGSAPGAAERELTRSIAGSINRTLIGQYPVRPFSRHSAVPLSTFANVFIWTSGLGEKYWDLPVSETALSQARPIGSVARALP